MPPFHSRVAEGFKSIDAPSERPYPTDAVKGGLTCKIGLQGRVVNDFIPAERMQIPTYGDFEKTL